MKRAAVRRWAKRWAAGVAVMLASLTTAGQNQPRPPDPEPLAPALVLDDLRSAYSQRPAAEDIQVRLRAPGQGERSETITVRTDPEPGAHALRQALLELDRLRVYFGGGEMIAISLSAPDRYYRATYTPPLTPEVVWSMLPPVPAPQIVLAGAPDIERPIDLSPYWREVVFTSAAANLNTRPPAVIAAGTCRAGPISIGVHPRTARLLALNARMTGPDGDRVMELNIRPLDPGDPGSWRPTLEGRTPVASLVQLRAVAAAPGPAEAPAAGPGEAAKPSPPVPAGEKADQDGAAEPPG
jgi:hypothetical protein